MGGVCQGIKRVVVVFGRSYLCFAPCCLSGEEIKRAFALCFWGNLLGCLSFVLLVNRLFRWLLRRVEICILVFLCCLCGVCTPIGFWSGVVKVGELCFLSGKFLRVVVAF